MFNFMTSNINPALIAPLVSPEVSLVTIRYAKSDPKKYTFKSAIPVEVGDLVLVPNQRGTFTAVEVLDVRSTPTQDELCNETDYKWVIGVVTSMLQKYEELEKRGTELVNQFQQQMDKVRAAEIQKVFLSALKKVKVTFKF